MGELGVTMTQLSQMTGISRQSLRFIVRNEKTSKIENALKICRALKIDDDKMLDYFPGAVGSTQTIKERT